MRFIGVDLGWKVDPPRRKGTGYCQVGEGGAIELATTVTTDQEIIGLVRNAGDAWVGIDASLHVANEEGLRPCERRLRDMGIKVLPTSRSFLDRRFGGSRGEMLVQELERLGFRLSKGGDRGARSIFEVFPHATLHLLSGGRRPEYKRGKRGERREGRAKVIELVLSWEPSLQAPDVLREEGLDDKEAEDILDAWVSVACVYSHWLNEGRRTLVIGEEGDGHILLGRWNDG